MSMQLPLILSWETIIMKGKIMGLKGTRITIHLDLLMSIYNSSLTAMEEVS